MTTVGLVLVAVAAGAAIGLSLGTLGAGGSILAVPVLVHLLGQSPAAATTGSLVVVGAAALVGAAGAWRRGTVLLARGVGFALVAVGGTVLGAYASALVPENVLLLAFGLLMLVVAVLMAVRARGGSGAVVEEEYGFEAIISFRPLRCACPRALKVLVTATAVGMLTGFLGVGGGFLVVPALVLSLGLPMRQAAGTSLAVIAVTSVVALSVRTGVGVHPDWTLVAALTSAAVVATVIGGRIAHRVDPARLQRSFTVVVAAVGVFTLGQALVAVV